ncbi:LacI family DNA-binding transcriptional regulator [Jiangella alkaliphila]|uniref:Transcriptional regulator, LacI family n=1 Tax=Jiangella alkaliphila TaxID=419479 RepID=A0A1H2LEC1_9ACTN|nr:LacI family DNA-binding transcriptional regulator [Jiangella alkaliphila]SDU79367.1 transcriptional regulator, LacI family [Jiangella alkaliphila]
MAETRRPPTAADVARLAGVSRATVSYVLSGRRSGGSRVRDETRQRILEAVRALDYVPDQSARALRRRSTERVCLVLPRLGVPYFDVLAKELQEAVAGHGYTLVITVSDVVDARSAVVAQLRRRLADGVVIVAGARAANEALAGLVDLGIAVVLVADEAARDGIDVVRGDVTEACRGGVEYLVSRGHRRIAFVGEFPPHAARHSRFDGYRAALEAGGLPLDRRLVVAGASSRAEAYRSATRVLESPDRPSAVFAATDIAAVSAIWAARDLGLRVPDDVAVIGVGNIDEDLVMNPPLTSVGPSSVGSAEIAELLIGRMAGEAPAAGRTRLQPWELIRRGSA